jgi:tetratricopeptide (TPR) repeat protein
MFLKRLFNFIPKSEFSRALGMFNTGHYRKALKKFEELNELSKAHEDVDRSTLELYTCEAHVALAKEYDANGQLEQAMAEMSRAVELKPAFADLHYLLGTYQFRLKRYPDAQDSFSRSLEINNKFFKAHVHLSLVLYEDGDRTRAVEELAKTKHSCPNFSREQLDNLMQGLRSRADEKDIRGSFHEILVDRPSSAQISRELAIEAIQNGEYEEGIRELKKAIAIKPDYPDLHNYLGIAYGNSGMVDDAVYEFEIALKINPYYMKARLNLALLYYENSRYEEAQVQLDEVLAVQPDNKLANNILNELRAVTDGK